MTSTAMQRYNPPAAERDSIFGDTYNGVPNPNVPFVHGYPTRYHGPIWTQPMPGFQYRANTYTKAPFLGVELFGYQPKSLTGSTLFDAAVGAAIGYVAASSETKNERLGHAAAGAAAVGMFGTIGAVGFALLEFYFKSKVHTARAT